MPDLSPLTALGETAPATETIGALTLTEVTGTALASLAIGRGATPPQPFGLTLPGPAHGPRAMFRRSGPGRTNGCWKRRAAPKTTLRPSLPRPPALPSPIRPTLG